MKNKTSVTPSVLFVDDLIEEVEKGGLKVPAFQRSYVWQKNNVLELFDSIYNGFPIGSILLWETDAKINSHDNFSIKKSNEKKDGYQYVLDGQQRLTTLYHCLTKGAGIDGIWDVYIDLEKDEFLYLESESNIRPTLFPLSKIINTMDFIKQSKKLLDETSEESYIEKAEKLANKIRKYKLPIITMEGGGLDEAIEIFTRLNKTGMQIIPIDLISALNYNNEDISSFENTKDEIYKTSSEFSFIPLDKDDSTFGTIVVRLIRISLNFELYVKDDTEKVAKLVRSESFNSLSEKIISSYEKSVKFLVKELRFLNISDLPYTNLIYMVFIYFLKENNDKEKLKEIIYLGSISGLFNVSPSGTQKLIEYFASGFDEKVLTKKLKETLNEGAVIDYLRDIQSGVFSARSALGKVTFNIISNYYLRKNESHPEFLKYPPTSINSSDSFKNRLGSKIFFTSTDNEKLSGIFCNNVYEELEIDNFILKREKCIYEIIRQHLNITLNKDY